MQKGGDIGGGEVGGGRDGGSEGGGGEGEGGGGEGEGGGGEGEGGGGDGELVGAGFETPLSQLVTHGHAEHAHAGAVCPIASIVRLVRSQT